ncbi:hypothetical protein [Bifidobacterium oedipodis]|uniref:hypothetical protein n=1 Tax=Bifidobacterium oedipodis TaxID=2675322 RepID=UPI00145CB3AF|nr:hypothetical protein [Bifidobacterium sp. DSM 109957]
MSVTNQIPLTIAGDINRFKSSSPNECARAGVEKMEKETESVEMPKMPTPAQQHIRLPERCGHGIEAGPVQTRD